MRKLPLIAAALVASALSANANAAKVMTGTLSSVALFNPAVTYSAKSNTYSAKGATYDISGTGGFQTAGNLYGALKGNLNFSSTVGATLKQNIANFFVFNDGKGGVFDYSVSSVRTSSFVNRYGTSSASLYILGSIVDPTLKLNSPTLAALTLQFNRTGYSAYSSALSLSVPASAVPEPAAWAMLIAGVGVAGGSMRRRQKIGAVRAA